MKPLPKLLSAARSAARSVGRRGLPGGLILALAFAVSAQDPKPKKPVPAGHGVTVELLRARTSALAADDRLDEAVRDQVSTIYSKAIKLLEAAAASEAAARNFQKQANAAPAETEELRQKLASGDVGVPALPEEDLTAARAAMDQALSGAQTSAAAFRSKAKNLEESIRALEVRPSAANAELLEERQKLKDLDENRQVSESGPSVMVEARTAQAAAERKAAAARIHLLEQELAAVSVRQELLRARSELVNRQLALVEGQVGEWQARQQRMLEREAAAEREHTERVARELVGKHPFLVAQAEENSKLSDRLSDLTEQLSETSDARARAEAMRTQLSESGAAAREAKSIASVSEDFSALLRQIRNEVPQVPALALKIRTGKQAVLDGRLARLRLRERLRTLRDVPTATARVLATRPADAGPLSAEARTSLDRILAKRRDLIGQVVSTYSKLIARTEELNTVQEELQSGAVELSETLQQRLLWLPSAPHLGISFGEDLWASLRWLAQPPGGWAQVWLAGWRQATSSIPVLALVVLVTAVFLGLLSWRRRLVGYLESTAERVGRVGTDAHHLTPAAVGISILLALPGALLLIFLGMLLRAGVFETEFGNPLGRALLSAGMLWVSLDTFRQMCRDKGVFGAHFGWSQRSRRVLSSNLGWLIVVLVPVSVLVVVTEESGSDVYHNSLGRLAFIVASVALSLFAYRVIHPRRGAFGDMLSRTGIVWRSRYVWFSLLCFAPITLGSIAAYGYFDTAALIQEGLFSTGWVAMFGVVGYSLVIRWVLVTYRRMALQRAREERAQARAAREQKSAAEAAGEAVPELEVPQIDLSSVGMQTRTLIRAAVGVTVAIALWMVWSEMFPALVVLDQIPAWHQLVVTENGKESIPVTWAAVLGGLMVLAATVLSYRNLPGLLEIMMFRKGQIDGGTRYAVVSISRYLIAVIGVLVAFHQIGWDWSKAQWIVAALGVGLGFGLQEIVANFVSGLIILFERPVRVGDTVTVGELSGTVSRLQIRATTITDWENREIIVPNKDLITGRVVNWTLTSAVTRLVLKVGVAYGTDAAKAQEVMLQTAKAVDQVLPTPAPTVFFLGFGDSALDFEVRVFVAELSHRLPVMHELHCAIHRALADAGIPIPFPQRDMHLYRQPEGDPTQASDGRGTVA